MRKATRALVALALTAAAVLAALVVPSAAHADPFRCGSFGSDPRSWCAYVKNAPSGLIVRSGPGAGYPKVGKLSNGTKVEIDCWNYGSSVNGYNIWAKLYSPSRSTWVSDLYLSTGRIQNFIPRC